MSTETRPFEPPAPDNIKGAAFVVACCMLLAVTTLIARALGPQIAGDQALHPFHIAWARFFFGAIAVLPFAMVGGHSLKSPRIGIHLGRVLCGLFGVVGMFAAAGLMPLAEATAISFLSPLFSMVFAVIVLREFVGPWRWGAAAIAFVGAMVLTRPGSDAFQPAALIALAAAAFMGAELIFIKFLSGKEPPLKILAINNCVAALIASAVVPFFWSWPTTEQWALMIAVGVIMVTAQSFFLRGIAIAEASVAAPFFYTTLIFAALYGWIVFGEVPTNVALAGSGLIVLGALVLTWRENIARNREAGGSNKKS